MRIMYKSLFFCLLCVLLAGLLLNACKEDKELDNAPEELEEPELSITMDADSLLVDVFQENMPVITGKVTAKNNLQSVDYYVLDIYDDLLPVGSITEFADSKQHDVKVDIVFHTIMVGFKVVAKDDKGNVVEKIIPLKVVDLLRWEPEVVFLPAGDTLSLTLSVIDTLPVTIKAKSDAGIAGMKFYLVEERNAQLSDVLAQSKAFVVRKDVQEMCDYSYVCTPYTVALKVAITNGKGHIKYVERPVKILDKQLVLPQITLPLVRDTIKASLSMASKTTLQIEVFSAVGLSSVKYYEHKLTGDSVLLKSTNAQGMKYADSYAFTVAANTKGFSITATNTEGASARLYKPAKQHNPFNIIVAKDGSGTHTTLKAAFAAIPDNKSNPTVVFIKKGVYREWLLLENKKTNVILVGEDRDSTIITYNAAAPNPYPADGSAPKGASGTEIGTMGSATLHVEASNFYAENLTIENSAGVSAGQAVALRTTTDKQVFVNCKLLGHQDTHYTHGSGRQYYKKCYIAGTVDFIFGGGAIFFDECTLYCRAPNGEVTAAAAAQGKYGYVFNNCRVEGNSGTGTFGLGRPWKDNCHVVFINTYMSSVIKSKGWDTWYAKDYKYYEYGSHGPGANNTATRGNNSTEPGMFKFLTEAEAADYTLEKVMRQQDNAAQTVDNWHPSVLINRADNILR